jgi:hypothetical protein
METISHQTVNVSEVFISRGTAHLGSLFLGEHGRPLPQDTCIIAHRCGFVKRFGKNFLKNIYSFFRINIHGGIYNANSSRRR